MAIFMISGLIAAGIISKKRKEEFSDNVNLIFAGLTCDLILGLSAGIAGIIYSNNTQKVVKPQVLNDLVVRESEMNQFISNKTGLNDYETASIKFFQNEDGQYKLKLFGNDANNELKNIVYTVKLDDYNNYNNELTSLFKDKLNREVEGNAISTSSDPTLRRKLLYDYKDKIFRVYNAIEKCIGNSLDYQVTNIGESEKIKSLLSKQYNAESERSFLVGKFDDYWHDKINTNYVFADNYIIDISNVYNKNDKYVVNVDCLQNNSPLEVQRTDGESYWRGATEPQDVKWYSTTGSFVVKGNNLSDEEVYQKICNGECELVNKKNQAKNQEKIAENNFELVY